MLKIDCFFIFLLAFAAFCMAEEPCSMAQPLLELKAGYFTFSDSKLRRVYDTGGLDIQISGSYPVLQCLHLYGSAEYLERQGSSLNMGDRSDIAMVPLSLGLKAMQQIIPELQCYITLGPRYFFVRLHTKSHSLDRHIDQNGLGGFANTGLYFSPCDHFLVTAFAEYSYKRMHFQASKDNTYGQKVQIGGFTLGGGIVYAF